MICFIHHSRSLGRRPRDWRNLNSEFSHQLNDDNRVSHVFCVCQHSPPQEINHWCHLTPRAFILSTSEEPRHVAPTVLWFSLPSSPDSEQAFSHRVMQERYGTYVGHMPYHEEKGVGDLLTLSWLSCWENCICHRRNPRRLYANIFERDSKLILHTLNTAQGFKEGTSQIRSINYWYF